MDPLSITSGSIQIIAFCVQCTVNIVKWVGEVRTVDQRIRSFCEEVGALQATYESLEASLRSPALQDAIRTSVQDPEGVHLWSHLHRALESSKETMARVNAILDEINSSHGFGRAMKKQLIESLNSGELSRLRQRIVFYNSNLSFPIQMMTIFLQLGQRDISQENQRDLEIKISAINDQIQKLIKALDTSDQTSSLGSQTLVGGNVEERHMEADLKNFAHEFLARTSVAASSKAGSTNRDDPSVIFQLKGLDTNGILASERRTRVDGWIGEKGMLETSSSSGLNQETSETPESSDSEDDTDIALFLIKQHLENGMSKVQQNKHEGAEKCFRKALAIFESHDFSEKLAHQPADVVLMLSDACIKQEKFDEAISLLAPVANKENVLQSGPTSPTSSKIIKGPNHKPTRGQALTASHMLGQAYLAKGEPTSADRYAKEAFAGRKRYLGLHCTKTRESVQLLIDIYRAQGDEEEAEAFEGFLQSPNVLDDQPTSIHQQDSADATPPTNTPPIADSYPLLAKVRQNTSRSFWKRRGQTVPQPNVMSGSNVQIPETTISRKSTLNQEDPFTVSPIGDATGYPHQDVRHSSYTSTTSTPEKSTSIYGEPAQMDQPPRLGRSLSYKNIEPTFLAVQQLCAEKKHSRAAQLGLQFLESYKSNFMLIRKEELKENIRKSGTLGLAGTGHGYSPLHFFVEISKTECAAEVDLLIKQGVDVNAIAYKAGMPGRAPLTALQMAVREGHQTITRLLLSSPRIKADVKDIDGFSPMLAACRKGFYDIVSQLLDHGVRMLPSDLPNTWYGNSLLHDAARQCDPELVGILLKHHSEAINLNKSDKFGKTPLMHAVIKSDITNLEERRWKSGKRRLKTVKLLLDAGADPSIHDKDQLTAREFAQKEEIELKMARQPTEGCKELLGLLESRPPSQSLFDGVNLLLEKQALI